MSGLQAPAAKGRNSRIEGAGLSALVYRSRAARPLSPPDLLHLTLTAQSRNRREAVTGVMLYDQSRFYQWLEGPEDGVERIMGSILRDQRHTDIEILDSKPVRERAFEDWSMKLAMPGALDSGALPEAIDPPREVVEKLHRSPDAAPAVLVALFSAGAQDAPDTLAPSLPDGLPLAGRTAAILRGVMLSTVVPLLVRRQGASGVPLPEPILPHARACELADLLVSTDRAAALALIGELQAGDMLQPLYATLFEPAARHLGDLWRDDDCSEFDVTLGLCRLQSAVDLLGSPVRPVWPRRHPAVLIAPEPGELHRLGAVLDGDVLRQAGWSPKCAFPDCDEALQDLLAASWFDALDLSLSPAFSRRDRLPILAETITEARRASLNPELVILVAGRAFVEDRGAGASVGADLASASSRHLDRSISRLLHFQGAGSRQ